jgi:hypothetical protein
MIPANYVAKRNAKDVQQEFICKFVEATPDIAPVCDRIDGAPLKQYPKILLQHNPISSSRETKVLFEVVHFLA